MGCEGAISEETGRNEEQRKVVKKLL